MASIHQVQVSGLFMLFKFLKKFFTSLDSIDEHKVRKYTDQPVDFTKTETVTGKNKATALHFHGESYEK